MLDYRAHKLLWLILLPFNIILKLSFYIIIFISVTLVERTSYDILIKIIIAYALTELIILLVINVTWNVILLPLIHRLFFWLVDIKPAQGTNIDEAKEVVLIGERFLLGKKLESEIENWTFEDTNRLLSLSFNWRQKLFFNAKNRLKNIIVELKRIHDETGKEPIGLGEHGIKAIKEKLEGGPIPWYETLIANQAFFNSIVAFIITVLTFSYIGH